MANKVYNMEGGLHSAAAYSAFENSMWGSCVASSSDFVATAGTGMNISLSAGNGMIDTGLGFSRRIASDAVNTISVDAASSANPRKDALVAYIDNGVTPTTSVLDNTNDILKFACVAGSPAATPAAPSDAAIQTAIGAGNPYVVLWYVTVPKSATSLSTATFTDNRNISSKIDGSNIKDGTVTSSKIDWATIKPYWKVVSVNSGTNSWTIPAGYRFYRLVIRCSTSATTEGTRPWLSCSDLTAASWSTGISQISTNAPTSFARTDIASSTLIAPLYGSGTTGALSPFAVINMFRTAASGTTFAGWYSASGGGADWTVQGKLEFTAKVADFNLYVSRTGGSTISNFAGYVEALVE